MSKFKKLALIVLTGIMTITALTGCSNINKEEVVMKLTQAESDKVVKEVSLDEFRYYYLNLKPDYIDTIYSALEDSEKTKLKEKYSKEYEEYSKEVTSPTFEDFVQENQYIMNPYWKDDDFNKLKKEVENCIKYAYAIEQLASENDITITDEDKKSINAELEEIKSYLGSEEAYNERLEEMHATNEFWFDLMCNYKLEEKLMKAVYGEDIQKNIDENFVRVKHVLIGFSSSATEEEKDKAYKKAQEVLDKANKGDDFDTLVKEYGEDPGMVNNTDGYYFTKDKMVKEFETASFALKDNEISNIITTSYGYHVILRLPMEKEYIEANYSDFIPDDIQSKMQSQIEEIANKLNIDSSKAYEKMKVSDLK